MTTVNRPVSGAPAAGSGSVMSFDFCPAAPGELAAAGAADGAGSAGTPIFVVAGEASAGTASTVLAEGSAGGREFCCAAGVGGTTRLWGARWRRLQIERARATIKRSAANTPQGSGRDGARAAAGGLASGRATWALVSGTESGPISPDAVR